MAATEDILVHVGLREVRTKIQKINKKMTTLQGNWGIATIKMWELDSEVANVRAQIQTMIQELTTKIIDD